MNKTLFTILFLVLISNRLFSQTLPFELEANNINFQETQLYASGDVIIKYKNYNLNATDVEFNRTTNQLLLKKKIELTDNKNNHLISNSLFIDLDNITGKIKKGKTITSQNFYVTSNEILITSHNIILKDTKITKCDLAHPHYYLSSKESIISKKNKQFILKDNKLYFYDFPIFYVPSFYKKLNNTQSQTNSFAPEFGYNQVDKQFLNFYLGYIVNNNITGKTGVGISQIRGFRFGATHNFFLSQNQTLNLMTYHISKTGFEGGINYTWEKKQKSLTKTFFKFDYLYDQINHNELYSALPNIQFGVTDIPSSFGGFLYVTFGAGYFEDRKIKANRQQLIVTSKETLFKLNNKTSIDNAFVIKNNYYSNFDSSWQRLFNTISLSSKISLVSGKVAYTHFIFKEGKSPFAFDNVNEIIDDEISFTGKINLAPILLSLEANYQIKQNNFRNLKYTTGFIIHCWQLNISIDPVWEIYSLGVSLPSF